MGNPEVIKQATVDFQFITNLIENIDNNDYFEDILSKLSARHKQRKITIDMFERLGLVIMGELTDKLGPDLMNAGAVEAWTKFYGAILDVIKRGL